MYMCKGYIQMNICIKDIYRCICVKDGKMHAGFINDAKEWAGELLSGQTKVKQIIESTSADNRLSSHIC